MKILKFGGSSIDSVENIRKMGEIVLNQKDRTIVIVAALGNVTDMLLHLAKKATIGGSISADYVLIKNYHLELVNELFTGAKIEEISSIMEPLFEELEKIIQGVTLIGELTPKTLDKILGFGERLSSLFLSLFLNIPLLDSLTLIQTDRNFGKANVDFKTTYQLIANACENVEQFALAAGFISSAIDGSMTTLGRGGSDYTASLFAAALKADLLEIWTDVDGFMTADQRIINKAYSIPSLSYAEALELSHFGAKVIYPPTILPVYQLGIPIHIKNILNPDGLGTQIGSSDTFGKDRPIKGISSISGISLITIQGLGMVGVTGISMRLFGALAKEQINVILISQASSENSISFAIDSQSTPIAESSVNQEFAKEMASGQIGALTCEYDLSIVAIVGERMKHSAGIAGKLFQTIGKNGINVISIAQGASEQNISWVVKNSDLRKTLNVVHESFFLSPFIELNIFLVGIGTVGRDLLKQISGQQEKLKREHRLKLKIAGVANSRKMIFDREGIEISTIKEQLELAGSKSDLDLFCRNMVEMNLFNSVFVDCTAEEKVANQYLYVIDNFISIVAANKIAASSEYSRYRGLKDLAAKHGVKFLFETNVGAGLPLISTINDLRRSGDRILKIEAVLSGTLNFIFNTFNKDIVFSKTIQMAKELGFSEPDPRIDLSGIDVIRKLVILARESGYKIEQVEVENSSFIPEKYFKMSIEDFWKSIPELDEEFERKRLIIESSSQKWRFVGVMQEGKASVSLQTVDARHPFYDLEGSNNIILLTTERYNEYPLQIKGYGAGAEVTAAGVFADLIKVSNI